MDNGLLPDNWSVREEGRWVLILIVMDNGLLLEVCRQSVHEHPDVLILIVMDNGLLQLVLLSVEVAESSLNPYCNG